MRFLFVLLSLLITQSAYAVCTGSLCAEGEPENQLSSGNDLIFEGPGGGSGNSAFCGEGMCAQGYIMENGILTSETVTFRITDEQLIRGVLNTDRPVCNTPELAPRPIRPDTTPRSNRVAHVEAHGGGCSAAEPGAHLAVYMIACLPASTRNNGLC